MDNEKLIKIADNIAQSEDTPLSVKIFKKLREELRKERRNASNETDNVFASVLLRKLYACYFSYHPRELNDKRTKNEMHADFAEIVHLQDLKDAREMYNEMMRIYLSLDLYDNDFRALYLAKRKIK